MASGSPPFSRPKNLSAVSSNTSFLPVSTESVISAGSARPQKQNACASALCWTGKFRHCLPQLPCLCRFVRAAKNRCATWAPLSEALPQSMRSILQRGSIVECERKKSIPRSRTLFAHDRNIAGLKTTFRALGLCSFPRSQAPRPSKFPSDYLVLGKLCLQNVSSAQLCPKSKSQSGSGLVQPGIASTLRTRLHSGSIRPLSARAPVNAMRSSFRSRAADIQAEAR
jgi:hypothetical protein